MKHIIFVLLALVVGFMAGMQSGIKRKPSSESALLSGSVLSQNEHSVDRGGESFREQDCSNPQSTDQQLWCEARNSFNEYSWQAAETDNTSSWNNYHLGYKDGSYDAHHARTMRVSGAEETQDEYSLGYGAGYASSMEAMGLTIYDCDEEVVQSEYQSRWCEAADIFTDSNAGKRTGNNPVLRTRFVDGYLSGGRIALTIPASIHELMADAAEQALEAKLPLTLGDHDEGLPDSARAFREGLELGYESMVNNVQDIMAQVMQEFMATPKK